MRKPSTVFFCLSLIIAVFAALASAQSAPPAIATSQLILPISTQLAPVTSAAVTVVGNPGPQMYCYWFVANYLVGGTSPTGPSCITGAPNTLSGSNYVQIIPAYPNGALVDVLRTSGPVPPTDACNCAVAVGVAAGSINDQSSSLNAYTITPFSGNQFTITIDNEVTGSGATHAILRQNGFFVADLSLAGAGGTLTGSGTTGTLPLWTGSSTNLGNSPITVSGGTVSVSGNLGVGGNVSANQYTGVGALNLFSSIPGSNFTPIPGNSALAIQADGNFYFSNTGGTFGEIPFCGGQVAANQVCIGNGAGTYASVTIPNCTAATCGLGYNSATQAFQSQAIPAPAGSQYALQSNNGAGGLAATNPPTSAGVYQVIYSGTGVPPSISLGGVSVDSQTVNYTAQCPTDRLGEIEFPITAATTLTVPQAGSSTCWQSNAGMVIRNPSSSTAILTIANQSVSCSGACSTFQPEGTSSFQLVPGAAAFLYSDATTSTGNWHDVPIATPFGGVNVQTTSYLATLLDKDKIIVMNCSSACALTLPATPPTAKWNVGVLSIGSTVATVSLNGLNFNGSSTAPTLATGFVGQARTDGSNYFGDLTPGNANNVNGGAIPASKAIVGTNSSRQIIDATSTTLPTAMMPALTGDVTNTAGSLATSVNNGSHITNSSIPNSGLVNTATTVNSQTCTLGSACTIPLSAENPQTATYQVAAGDFSNYKTILVASGTFTITLVASGTQPPAGQYIKIINYGSGVVTVARSGQNINGAAANLTLAASSAASPSSVYVESDGTNYFADSHSLNATTLIGKTWAAPANLGTGTPASGAFTTISEVNLLTSNAAPTISSGFGTSPSIASSNGTAAFTVNVGTGGTATSGVIGLPTAANGWVVHCDDLTTQSASVFITKQTASSTTTATVTQYNTSGVATAWVASDILHCMAFGR